MEGEMSRGRPRLKMLNNIMDGDSYAKMQKAAQEFRCILTISTIDNGNSNTQAMSPALDCTKLLAAARPVRHSQPAHEQNNPETLTTLTSVSMNHVTTEFLPFLVRSLADVSSPGQRLRIPAPLLHYPPMSFFPFGFHPQSADLQNLNFLHCVNRIHVGSPEQQTIKTPINKNYIELALLVCNKLRGKLFHCLHCRYVTNRRNNLKRHMSTMHQICDKLLECCGMYFSTKASLREHIIIFHHNGYSCPYCGSRFCRKALLERHLSSVHSGQKDYTCPSCDYATSHKSNLGRHKRIHDKVQLGGKGSLSDCADFSGHQVQSPSPIDTSCIDEANNGDKCVLKDDTTNNNCDDLDVPGDNCDDNHIPDDKNDDIDIPDDTCDDIDISDDTCDDIDGTDNTSENDSFSSSHFISDIVRSPCPTILNRQKIFPLKIVQD